MKIGQSSFITSAVEASQYPAVDGRPEIAFAGRSNVGKSSLINMLLNRKALARTSGKPGKTQTINFFNVDDKLRFVDLPGYGFARVSKSQKERWGEYIESYLNTRTALLEVFLLVDIRHKPNPHDCLMYEYITGAGFNGFVLATKLDKIRNNQLMTQIAVISEALKIDNTSKIIPVSSTKRKGKYKTWDLINDILAINDFAISFQRQQVDKHWMTHAKKAKEKRKRR